MSVNYKVRVIYGVPITKEQYEFLEEKRYDEIQKTSYSIFYSAYDQCYFGRSLTTMDLENDGYDRKIVKPDCTTIISTLSSFGVKTSIDNLGLYLLNEISY